MIVDENGFDLDGAKEAMVIDSTIVDV